MTYNKVVRAWLIVGCILVFFQIFIGGVTRITGSGLSITKWEIVTGTLPPMSQASWDEAFGLYKETPQYLKINQGMSLSDFKFIYFWEYFHRLWARLMGFIFIFPFIFFIWKKWIDKWIIRQLLFVIFWAMMAAVFGWVMVASGLVNRPWVNAYKLSLHLGIALATLSFLIWGTYRSLDLHKVSINNKVLYKLGMIFMGMLLVQIFFGAVLSGMRAALYYPTWPDMKGQFIPDILFESESWNMESIVVYDSDTLMPALIHVLHRNFGYIVYAFGMYLSIKIFRYPLRRIFYIGAIALIVGLNLQVMLGILTLIYSKQAIPLTFGVLHQAVAILLLCISLFHIYIYKSRSKP